MTELKIKCCRLLILCDSILTILALSEKRKSMTRGMLYILLFLVHGPNLALAPVLSEHCLPSNHLQQIAQIHPFTYNIIIS